MPSTRHNFLKYFGQLGTKGNCQERVKKVASCRTVSIAAEPVSSTGGSCRPRAMPLVAPSSLPMAVGERASFTVFGRLLLLLLALAAADDDIMIDTLDPSFLEHDNPITNRTMDLVRFAGEEIDVRLARCIWFDAHDDRDMRHRFSMFNSIGPFGRLQKWSTYPTY